LEENLTAARQFARAEVACVPHLPTANSFLSDRKKIRPPLIAGEA
jgi:hypothetical protein